MKTIILILLLFFLLLLFIMTRDIMLIIMLIAPVLAVFLGGIIREKQDKLKARKWKK